VPLDGTGGAWRVRATLDGSMTGLFLVDTGASFVTLTLDDARGALVDAPAHTVTREARVARPLARVLPLFERCRALLDTWTLEAPVIAVRVAVAAVAPLTGEQGDLLSASWRDLGDRSVRTSVGACLTCGLFSRQAQTRDARRPLSKPW